MAQDKTIGELAELSALTGAEMIPVETANGNNKITTDAIKTFTKPKEWVLTLNTTAEGDAAALGQAYAAYWDVAEIDSDTDLIKNGEKASVGDIVSLSDGEMTFQVGIIVAKGIAYPDYGPQLHTFEIKGLYAYAYPCSISVELPDSSATHMRCTLFCDRNIEEFVLYRQLFGIPKENKFSSNVTLHPNILCKMGEMKSLTVTLGGVPTTWDGIVHNSENFTPEYMLEFISGETSTNLTLPADVKFPEEPTIEANKRYQLSIVNNIALLVGVDL